MSLYRLKQFYWAVSSFFRKVDYNYINEYLNLEEIEFFNRLKKSEKLHCIRVSKDAAKYYESISQEESLKYVSKDMVIKLGLLHDIGKIKQPLTAIDKSIVVILNKLTKGKLRNNSKSKKVYIYYNHPEEGAKILKNIGYDEDFLNVVKSHHKKIQNPNMALKILKYADNKN